MIDEKLTKNLQEQITENKNDITSLKNKTTLWTNPNPTDWFDSQTITLSDNMNNYRYLIIEFLTYLDRNSIYTVIMEDYTKKQEYGTVFNSGGWIFVCSRLIEPTSNNQLYVEKAYGYWNFNTGNPYDHPDWLIPQKVIGVK